MFSHMACEDALDETQMGKRFLLSHIHSHNVRKEKPLQARLKMKEGCNSFLTWHVRRL